jgi:hypothetical protein
LARRSRPGGSKFDLETCGFRITQLFEKNRLILVADPIFGAPASQIVKMIKNSSPEMVFPEGMIVLVASPQR